MIDPALEPEVYGTASRRLGPATRSGATHLAHRRDVHTPLLGSEKKAA